MRREGDERDRTAPDGPRPEGESAEGTERAEPGTSSDPVEEASKESFPASDPPAWIHHHIGGPDDAP